jgi:hypothetical protein
MGGAVMRVLRWIKPERVCAQVVAMNRHVFIGHPPHHGTAGFSSMRSSTSCTPTAGVYSHVANALPQTQHGPDQIAVTT